MGNNQKALALESKWNAYGSEWGSPKVVVSEGLCSVSGLIKNSLWGVDCDVRETDNSPSYKTCTKSNPHKTACKWDKTQHVESKYSCQDLPISMTGNKHPRGCPGAVYSNGSPNQGYCFGNKGKHPWWKKCCMFNDGKCISKTNNKRKFTLTNNWVDSETEEKVVAIKYKADQYFCLDLNEKTWDDGTNGKQSVNWGASTPTRHLKYTDTLDACKALCRVDHGKKCKAVEYRENHECRTFGYSVTRQYYTGDWTVSLLTET